VTSAEPLLRTAIDDFLQSADLQEPLTSQLGDILRTEIGVILAGRETEFTAGQPGSAAVAEFNYLLTENEQGRLIVPEERGEEVKNFVANDFARHREIRRRGRIVDEFAAQLADPQLSRVYSSIAGKLLLAEQLEIQVRRQPVDGLALWLSDHFDETAAGFEMKAGMDESLQSILDLATEVAGQLSQDDF
jgi:hypothetical protein